jgi:PRTRC genetic system protein B
MQVDISIEKSHHFELTQALLIYRSNQRAFVTKHEVRYRTGEAPVLCEAAPLRTAFLHSLVRDLQGSIVPEVFPENILARTEQMICWWTPAQQRQMFFGGTQKDMSQVNGAIFPHPPLVWIAINRQLYLRALLENARPVASTKMCFAPYWNIDEEGSVCLGSMDAPKVTTIRSIPQWEKSFYESEFTHGNVGRVTRHKGGFEGLWKALPNKAEFPMNALVALPETLEKFLKQSARIYG